MATYRVTATWGLLRYLQKHMCFCYLGPWAPCFVGFRSSRLRKITTYRRAATLEDEWADCVCAQARHLGPICPESDIRCRSLLLGPLGPLLFRFSIVSSTQNHYLSQGRHFDVANTLHAKHPRLCVHNTHCAQNIQDTQFIQGI